MKWILSPLGAKRFSAQQVLKSIEVNQEKQHLELSTTIMKYECLDCGTTFDTPADHRKHYQAFHGTIRTKGNRASRNLVLGRLHFMCNTVTAMIFSRIRIN